MDFTFNNPQYLWILLGLPVLVVIHLFTLKYSKSAALKIANFEALERISKGDFLGKPYKGLFRNKDTFLLLFRILVYSLMILSISGATLWYVGKTSSFNFVLTLDSSSSMLADDLKPNRLFAAKEAATTFVDSVSSNTDIGIVSFSGVAYINSGLSKDAEKTKESINSMSLMESGGTNIGDAVMSSVNVLLSGKEDGDANVIVLLTDGQSNVGTPVEQAIEYAKKNNIIIHTIGVGTAEGGSFLTGDIISKLDENSLIYISNSTGGRYYRAESKEILDHAYTEIASITERRISIDLSWILLLIALIMLSLEWILINTRYRTIPG